MTDHSERDEAAEKYADRFPTKSEWCAGLKDTHSYLSYEVKYEVEQAFSDGADWAVKNDPRVLKLVEQLKMCVAHSVIPYGPDSDAIRALTEWSKP